MKLYIPLGRLSKSPAGEKWLGGHVIIVGRLPSRVPHHVEGTATHAHTAGHGRLHAARAHHRAVAGALTAHHVTRHHVSAHHVPRAHVVTRLIRFYFVLSKIYKGAVDLTYPHAAHHSLPHVRGWGRWVGIRFSARVH